jgi:Zn-dependent protease with chaperone function
LDRPEFDVIVRRAEQYAQAQPAAYRLRVIGLGVLGYAYVALVLAGLSLALALLAFVMFKAKLYALGKLLLPLVILIGMVLRAFWVKFEPPAGRPLVRAEVPRLFELVEDVVARTGAPRPHAILLVQQLNAAIVQQPRLGPLFGYRNYLVLGLPLLAALSTEEFRAVLAHECGHLSGSHGKAGAWVYRVRTTWNSLTGRLSASQHWGRHLFVPFLNWYAPRFQAYSFVMARQQEYAADQVAASATAPAAIATALVRTRFADRWLDEQFWPALHAAPETRAEPDVTPFAAMAGQISSGLMGVDSKRWLAAALERDTGSADTHPSLRDRLRALGIADPPLEPVARSAADELLGAARAPLTAEMDARWRGDVSDWWQREHAQRAERRARRTTLEDKATTAPLERAEQFELAWLYRAIGDDDRARPLLEAVLAVAPDDADAHAQLGFVLAQRNDPAAVGHLEFAIGHDEEWIVPAGEILYGQLMRVGRTSDAGVLATRVNAHRAEVATRERERKFIRKQHRYVALTVDAEVRRQLLEALAAEAKHVRRAWLIGRIAVANRPPIPLLIVEPRTPWWRYRSGTGNSALVGRLAPTLPLAGELQFTVLDQRDRWLVAKTRAISGSLLYKSG